HAGALAGHALPSARAQREIIAAHYEAMLQFYGREGGLRHARKHLGWYLDRLAPDLETDAKAAIFRSTDPDDVMRRMMAAINAAPAAAREAA
ncbi:MAG: tRNA-dihydrouridine synthase, partial [Pseudorhizobium sp.]